MFNVVVIARDALLRVEYRHPFTWSKSVVAESIENISYQSYVLLAVRDLGKSRSKFTFGGQLALQATYQLSCGLSKVRRFSVRQTGICIELLNFVSDPVADGIVHEVVFLHCVEQCD